MALLIFDKVSLAFGLTPLLDDACFNLNKGEKLCLIGRNGAGKSSLFGILSGRIQPDDGLVKCRKEIIISELPQSLPASTSESVFEFVAKGMGATGRKLQDYQRLSQKEHLSSSELNELHQLQLEIESCDGWQIHHRIERILSDFALKPEDRLSSLSGGWKKKVALARAVVIQPDVLLLDEPTNHLDIYAIQWLEKYIEQYQGTVLLITHDRTFMDKVASRIIELDRGQINSYEGNYSQYRKYKDAQLAAETRANNEFDKKLAQEEIWIRQGIKARRTRNEGRVRALKALRKQREDRVEVQGKASFKIEQQQRSGKLVAELTQVCHGYEGKTLIKDFTTTIMRGDKVALIGPNGCGKTTLLKILLGQIKPDSGTVRTGTNLDIAYFDQNRDTIHLDKTVQDNVSGGKDELMLGGRSRHVISYLQDFLFSPQRIRTPASALSGGELNRLVLAKLFSKPSNLLVLDEPTNDLDMETLELLEELIADYQGTLLLVSHDRFFVDNTVASCIVFDGFPEKSIENEGRLIELIGGFSDWENYQTQLRKNYEQTKNENIQDVDKQSLVSKDKITDSESQNISSIRKLSYKQQRRLEQLPDEISEYEKQIEILQHEINQSDFYKKDHAYTTEKISALEQMEEKLNLAFEEWEELEDIQP